MPELIKRTLETCTPGDGTLVVIDVLRAFSTSAYAFASGAREIIPVAGVREALELRQDHMPDALVMGELNGKPIPGYDLGNSPYDVMVRDLTGRRLIHRTSAGTQGLVRSIHAQTILAASFVCARATARRLRQLLSPRVAFVITGTAGQQEADEDNSCADYIAALMEKDAVDPAPFLERVLNSYAGRDFMTRLEENMPRDLDLCLQADRFDFYQAVTMGDDGYLRIHTERS